MLIKKTNDIPSSEITPRSAYLNRRSFMAGAAALGIAGILTQKTRVAADAAKLQTVKSPLSTTGLTPTSFKDITSYNNFYEFGVEKDDPAKNAGRMKTRPWTVTVDGLVKEKKKVGIDELLSFRPIEERVYRHRCVEAWSMVIPWAGYSLSELIKWAEPLPKAKYVQFLTLEDRAIMPGISRDQPELALLRRAAHGRGDASAHAADFRACTGKCCPTRMAPRCASWCRGNTVSSPPSRSSRIHFTSDQPNTAWNEMAPREYGFYSNVNPNVDHPRWSQKTERRIGASLFNQRQPTLMFNGYEDQVASLYNGMDLKKNF